MKTERFWFCILAIGGFIIFIEPYPDVRKMGITAGSLFCVSIAAFFLGVLAERNRADRPW